jgi:hypothetical protein
MIVAVTAKAVYRPYFFEIFALANFLIVTLLVIRHTRDVLTSLPTEAFYFGVTFFIQAASGVVVRLIVAAARGKTREYLAVLRSPAWLLDTLRIMVFALIMLHVYCWIKITLPLMHPRLFDQPLWDFDSALLAGHSPTVLMLSLFANRPFLRFVDFTYIGVFTVSLHIAFAWVFSEPDRRLRVAFANSNTLMWIAGAWIYFAIPSLGPAYRFPDVWMPYSDTLSNTQEIQRKLMTNYRAVLDPAHHHVTVNIAYGIAAFPSLHVGFQVLMFLWMRRVWRWGEILFGVFAVFIFIGSMVTGWHYLIDSIAGAALAAACYAVAQTRISPPA